MILFCLNRFSLSCSCLFIPSVLTVIENGLDAVNCYDWLKGLILDGIVAGVGAVSGATYSYNAIIKAVQKALDSAK